MGPVAGGRSLAILDNARGWPLVSFLLPFLVRMHPKVRRYLAIGKPPSVNRVPSPLIVLMNQIGVNQVNVDGLPTYISSTAGAFSESDSGAPMSNTSIKVALVFLVVLALPTDSFARGGGAGGGARGGASATTGLSGGVRPNAGLLGAVQSQVTDPSGIGNASKVAPIPPPRISAPTVPQFK